MIKLKIAKHLFYLKCHDFIKIKHQEYLYIDSLFIIKFFKARIKEKNCGFRSEFKNKSNASFLPRRKGDVLMSSNQSSPNFKL